ncbi:futalosine hydrolase [Micromonospora phaseoli]|uniref:Futalosine hydrolase n=1 Tax=Micromonospora phaseoli TaxID=1144548 RepID=A0A1H7ARB3_9ACTN|nr:futalosine hydrolase [Micromonospora phaseoli]PZV96393.1 futalosine hydrolase [Micromonospora phaseoli]GIJ76080.1 Futalosine hydrolase [Micromonospora phaseoli]SEJ64622.1 futalosine hydrolase [Micromonospora phaseoli]
MTGLLVVTAVPAEAEAIQAGLADPTVAVVPVGVGPAVAGAATARLLALAEMADRPYRGVISAGVAGGFVGRVAVGDIVLGTRAVAADLGAESPDGFIPVDKLGMPPELLGGGTDVAVDSTLLAALRAALPDATVGPVLTVSTVTGTTASTDALSQRHPDAVAEAMEGYGVAVAASHAGVPFAELRAISNPIGPRDRDAWRLRDALAALTAAAAALR